MNTHTRSPRRALSAKLHGARPVEHFGLSPQVRGAAFDGPAGAFALVWRENADEDDLHSYPLSVRGAVEAQDLFGRPLKTGRADNPLSVTVSEIPIYLMGGQSVPAAALAAAVKEAGRPVDFRFDKPLKNSPFGPGRFRRRAGT